MVFVTLTDSSYERIALEGATCSTIQIDFYQIHRFQNRTQK